MRLRAGVKMAGMAMAVLGGLGAVAAEGETTFPDMTVPQTCCVQIKNNKVENLDPIRDAGFKFVRRGFKWDQIEKEKDVYDFTEFDEFVKNCEERGLRILGCLALGNKFHGTVAEDEGRAAYVKYAAATVGHFKGRNIIWEIWNEPNVSTFWGKRPGGHNSDQYSNEYVALVKAVVPEMKKADPGCKILGGSVSNIWSASYNWMTFCFQKGILKSGIDGWSIHPYTPKKPEGHIEGYETSRRLLEKYAGNKDFPLFNSERGFPLGKAEGASGGRADMAKEYQAWHVVRQYMIDLYCNVGLTNWYEWDGNEGFALMGPKGPQPAYHAVKTMIEQLRGYKFAERVALEGENDYVFRFTNPQGGVKLVAWTAPNGEVSPDFTVDHEVAVPVAAAGDLEVVKLYGEKASSPVADGKVRLQLSGAPQYVTIKAPTQ